MVKKRKSKSQKGDADMDTGEDAAAAPAAFSAATSAAGRAMDADAAGFLPASDAVGGAGVAGAEAGGLAGSGNAMDMSETMGFTVIKASDGQKQTSTLGLRKKGAPERRAKTKRKQQLLNKALAIREKTETKQQKHAAKKARIQTLKKLY